jgi:large conductance mechanosensitive channel
MRRLIDEFKAFALRGNLVDLAVAVILGLAFNAVVLSLVNDVFLQIVAAIVGEPDFSELSIDIGEGRDRTEILYGSFLTALINFLLVAFVLFLVVKAVNRATRRQEEPPSVRECPYCKTNVPVTATRCSACTSQLEASTV